jgi:hypothetical protein
VARVTEYREISFTIGYRVGDDGTVWTRRNARWGLRQAWRRLRGGPDSNGYPTVTLMMPDKSARVFRVNVLVLLAFVGDRPPGADSCHENGIASDCRLDNLRWDTRAANMRDAVEHGSVGIGEDSHAAKLNDQKVREIRASVEPLKVTAAKYGVSIATVSQVRNRITWKHVQ